MMSYRNPVAVAYYRVSTDKQGRSGLGLEAQEAAVSAFCAARGLTLAAAFTEVESGRKDERPELAAAFAYARKVGGIVVIAKLDRLARDVHFIAGLIKQRTPFVCADCPEDDTTMLHFRAVIAEDEARRISQRTKAALAAAKARGVKLGNARNLGAAHREKGAATMRARGERNRAALRDRVIAARVRGLSLREIAKEIGCGTMTVQRVLKAR